MIKHRTKLITPKMAQAFLDKAVDSGIVNRKISQKTVNQYAEAMKNGNWKLNGESIAFDENGFLLNGQHRLMACIQANVPFLTDISTNVPRDTFDTFDCGRTRSAGQVLQIANVKYYNTIASIVRGLEELRSHGHTGNTNVKITNMYVLDEYQKNKELYDEIAVSIASNPSRCLSAKMLGSVYFYLVHDLRQNLETVDNFIHGITSLDSNPNPAIDKFRKWLIISKNKSLHKTNRTLYGFIVLTWNAMVEGAEKLPTYSDKCEESFANEMPEFVRIK